MICPVCGKKYSFFGSAGGGVYCSPACAEAAVKELEALLQSMMQEEDEDSEDEHND